MSDLEYSVAQAEKQQSRNVRLAGQGFISTVVLEESIDRLANAHWGMLFREGMEPTRFGDQIEDYACIYTSRVSNFLYYSPTQYFRSQSDLLPHERR